MEQKRQKVLQSLVEAESTFHSVLQNGIETYLEPLRSVVSETIHSTLFFNLKELFEVSRQIELQLKERMLQYVGGATKEATPHFITHVADVYHSQRLPGKNVAGKAAGPAEGVPGEPALGQAGAVHRLHQRGLYPPGPEERD
jgi:hypothetical protein